MLKIECPGIGPIVPLCPSVDRVLNRIHLPVGIRSMSMLFIAKKKCQRRKLQVAQSYFFLKPKGCFHERRGRRLML